MTNIEMTNTETFSDPAIGWQPVPAKAQDLPCVDEEQLLRRFIGRNPEPFIRTYLKMMDKDPSLRRLVIGWNWPAFLLLMPWAMYRKMWALLSVSLLVPILVQFIAFGTTTKSNFSNIIGLGIAALAAMVSKSLYVSLATRRIRKLRARGLSDEDLMKQIDGRGVSIAAAVIGSTLLVCLLVVSTMAAGHGN